VAVVSASGSANRELVKRLVVVLLVAVAGWGLFEWVLRFAMQSLCGVSFENPLVDLRGERCAALPSFFRRIDSVFYAVWPVWCLCLAVAVLVARCGKARDGRTRDDDGSARRMLWIFAVGFVVRAIFLPRMFGLPFAGDEWYYWWVPRHYAEGDLTSTTLRPPLWGALLAIPEWVHPNPLSGRALSVVLGALAPVLVYRIGKRVFDERTGWVAGLLYALYPTHIGYSHGLWAEVLFGVLVLLAVDVFWSWAEEPKRHGRFVLAFAIAGTALLAKEFAVVLFVGFAVATVVVDRSHVVRKGATAIAAFLVLAFGYSLTVSALEHRAVVLSDAPVSNFRAAAGLPFEFDYNRKTTEDRAEVRAELLAAVRDRSIADHLRNTRGQVYNLWTPNSFPITRLFGEFRNWTYGVDDPWPWTIAIVGFYIAVVAVGLVGLCGAPPGPFRAFAITLLVALSLTSVAGDLCSRFRLAFMFVFVLFTANFLVHRRSVIARLHEPAPMLAAAALLLLFAHVLVVELPHLGEWG